MSFRTLLACVLCKHTAEIDPPNSHPPCPKCGGPVKLTTVSVDGGADTKGALLTIEGAFEEFKTFVRSLAERVSPEAKIYFAKLAEEVSYLPGELEAFLGRSKQPTPTTAGASAVPVSNVKEVLQDLTGLPPGEAAEQVGLPPGSA